MFSPKFNEYCFSLLTEAIDDYFNDGSFSFDNGGAREFAFAKHHNLLIHNVGNIGHTHALALRVLTMASIGKIKPNEQGNFEISHEGIDYTYKIHGEYNNIVVNHEELILGRYWNKRDDRIKGLKPFGFWINGDDSGEDGINDFIKSNLQDIRMIWEFLGILPREYVYQFNFLYGKRIDYTKTFEEIIQLR